MTTGLIEDSAVNPQARPFLVVGAGGHALSVAENIVACGHRLVGFIDPAKAGRTLLGRPILAAVPDDYADRGGCLAMAIGDNAGREAAWGSLGTRFPPDAFPALIHPAAAVSVFAEVAAGTIVQAGALVDAATHVDICCVLGGGSVLGHESTMRPFSSILAHATIGGRVTIGDRSAVALGATVKPRVTMGHDSVLGAHSYLHRDLGDNLVAYGSPARVVRARSRTDPYLD
jgi:sugar O-acyltransferase (sialic acid O-acetyltransferase NeuD family)